MGYFKLTLVFFTIAVSACRSPSIGSGSGKGGGPPSFVNSILRSFAYMGFQDSSTGRGVIVRGYVDHRNDLYVAMPQVNLSARGGVSWMEADLTNGRVFASSRESATLLGPGMLNVFNLGLSGNLLFDQNFAVANDMVHFSMHSLGSGQYLGGTASPNNGLFEVNAYDVTQRGHVKFTSTSFGAGSITHSSTYDQRLRMFYVANSGAGTIEYYHWNGRLQVLPIGTLTGLTNPRIVYYSKRHDLVYLITEDKTANSWIRIYKAVPVPTFDLIEVDNFMLPGLDGADLKIDFQNDYLIASVRQVGSSGVQFIPLTSLGMIDRDGRPFLFMPTLEKPRSLALSSDGKYVMAIHNQSNQRDLTVIKTDYSSSKELRSAFITGTYELGGTAGYASGMVIDEMRDGTYRSAGL